MELDAGIELHDVAGIEISASLGKKIEDVHARLTRPRPHPIRKPIGNSLVQSAGAPTPIILKINDTPATGRMWFVKKVAVFGTDGHTTVTGAIADVYAGALEEVGGVPITDFSSQIVSGGAGNVPSVTRYGRFDQPMHSHEYIYAILYAVPANQQIALIADVDEWLVEDMEAMDIP